jgi:carbon-monoxide dehydrogenase medium subunit
VKPSAFAYHAPGTVEEALSLLAEHGSDARPLAGGQSLVPMMNFRLARPSVLVDLNGVSGLSDITTDGSTVTMGAMVRERAAERSDAVAAQVPLLARALPLVGHEAIRTRGTIGGSLAHSDPASELPAVALAVGCQMVARRAEREERVIDSADFFLSYFTTALEADELLTGVRFPAARPGTGVAFEEMARRHGDFAIVGVGVTLHAGGAAAIDEVRVVLTGVGATPIRSRAAESFLVGHPPGAELFAEAASAAARDIDPPSDLHGSAAYRRHVAGTLVRRALARAAEEMGSAA